MAFTKRQREGRGIHAFVATPAYDGKVHTDYALSLAESFQMATAYGINCTAAIIGNGAFIELVRNEFVRQFLQTDCTHLFFIDADLKFEPRAFCGLLTAGLPVCAGAYRRRQEPESYPIRWIEDENGGLIMENNFLLCNRVATGFLCIRRDVIEDMAERAPKFSVDNKEVIPKLFHTFVTPDNKFMGEDFAWCDDYCHQSKRPIYVWPDFNFVHAGYKCNFNNWLIQETEKGKQAQVSSAA